MSRIAVKYASGSFAGALRYLDQATGRLHMSETAAQWVNAGYNRSKVEDNRRVFYATGEHPVISVYLEVVAPTSAPTGQKFDGDKDEPGLLLSGCHLAVAGIIKVLGFGFKKYGKRNGWKEVPEARRRYKDALHRHLAAIERGELVDPDSGLPHIDHVACNAAFLSQMHHEGFGQ